jgi:uncharacterized membrane protein
MKHSVQDIAKKFFPNGFESLTEREKKIVRHVAERTPISRNTNQQFLETFTLGERLADRVAAFGGSWTFILLFVTILVGWIVLNSVVLVKRGSEFDPYPYILLNLFLSMVAALQAPVIMMSQNRHAAKDRMDATHDYEVNMKSELEIMALHEKMDSLREPQWQELLLLQQKQIQLLTQLLGNRASTKMETETKTETQAENKPAAEP